MVTAVGRLHGEGEGEGGETKTKGEGMGLFTFQYKSPRRNHCVVRKCVCEGPVCSDYFNHPIKDRERDLGAAGDKCP